MPGIGQQVKPAAQGNEPSAHLADRRAIVLAKVGNRLVIRHQAAGQPHHFHIAPGLPFKAPARLNPVEVAVNIELQQYRRMIARPAGRLGRNPAKAQAAEIKLLNKDIDHPHRIVFANPIIQPLRKQSALAASLHPQ